MLALGLAACIVGSLGAYRLLHLAAETEQPPTQKLVQDLIALPFALAHEDGGALATKQVGSLTEDADSQGTEAPFISETTIRSGDNLASVLKRLGLTDTRLLHALTHDAKARSIYKLYPGRSVIAATNNQGDFLWLRYIHTPATDSAGQALTKLLELRSYEGGFVANELEEPTEVHTEVAVGTITRSLFAATDEANIPDAITSQMAEILGSKIDFLRGLRKGDQFRVVYETRTHQGRSAGAGKVLALQFINQDKAYSAVWFSSGENTGGYYSLEGESMRGSFLRNALKFSRISSGFGSRRDPIHGAWSGHAGIDYAAPTGTPIQATADGIVELAGWQNGYGNVVILKHNSNISTLYAHQSSFAPGISKGARVSQGQLLGYVGSTGWSTGSHLHYEFRIGEKAVDPLAVILPESPAIEAAQLPAFATAVAPFKQQLEVLAGVQMNRLEDTSIASR